MSNYIFADKNIIKRMREDDIKRIRAARAILGRVERSTYDRYKRMRKYSHGGLGQTA